MNPRHDAAAVWRGRIEAQAVSGLSIAEFCKQQPCSVGSFYQWKRRLAANDVLNDPAKTRTAQSGVRHQFVQVPTEEVSVRITVKQIASPVVQQRVEVILASGTIIRIPAGDSETLVIALRSLQHCL